MFPTTRTVGGGSTKGATKQDRTPSPDSSASTSSTPLTPPTPFTPLTPMTPATPATDPKPLAPFAPLDSAPSLHSVLPVEVLRLILAHLHGDGESLRCLVRANSHLYNLGIEVLYEYAEWAGGRWPPFWARRRDVERLQAFAALHLGAARQAWGVYPVSLAADVDAETETEVNVDVGIDTEDDVEARERRGPRPLALASPQAMVRYLTIGPHAGGECAGRALPLARVRVLRVRFPDLVHRATTQGRATTHWPGGVHSDGPGAACALLPPAGTLVVRGLAPWPSPELPACFPDPVLRAARHVVVFLSPPADTPDTMAVQAAPLLRLAQHARTLSVVFDAPPNTAWARGGGRLASLLVSERGGLPWFHMLATQLALMLASGAGGVAVDRLRVELVNTRALGINLEFGGVTSAWLRGQVRPALRKFLLLDDARADRAVMRLSARSMKEFIADRPMRGILDDDEVETWKKAV